MDVHELMQKQEPLCDELRQAVRISGDMVSLHHPLMVEAFYISQMNALYNARLAAKREAFNKAVKDKEWMRAAMFVERPYRMEFVAARRSQMTRATYWSVLRYVLTDTENQWEYKRIMPMLIAPQNAADLRLRDEHLMDAGERDRLAALPDVVTVYRGCRAHNRTGWSWTTDYEKAVWFARRFHRPGIIRAGRVRKYSIVAVFDGRNESEVLVHPRHVRSVVESSVGAQIKPEVHAEMMSLLTGR